MSIEKPQMENRTLSFNKDQLESYLPEGVKNEIAYNLGTEYKNVNINLLIDIKDNQYVINIKLENKDSGENITSSFSLAGKKRTRFKNERPYREAMVKHLIRRTALKFQTENSLKFSTPETVYAYNTKYAFSPNDTVNLLREATGKEPNSQVQEKYAMDDNSMANMFRELGQAPTENIIITNNSRQSF